MRALSSPWITIALAYWLAGHLALGLAIPPGYTAPFFPSAGIALAALIIGGLRYWPAVLYCIGVALLFTGISAIIIATAVSRQVSSQAVFTSQPRSKAGAKAETVSSGGSMPGPTCRAARLSPKRSASASPTATR